jgi:hypothetical protein
VPSGQSVDEAVDDTEAVLAAYRERKRKALEAARGEPVQDAEPTQPTPHVRRGRDEIHPRMHDPLGTTPDLAPPQAPPVALAPATPIPPPPSTSLQVQRPGPAALATSAGATLSPLGPTLRLSDALLKDRKVSLRGSPRTRVVGVTLFLLGLGLAVVERRQAALGAPVEGLGIAAVLLAAIGIVVAGIGLVWPRSRRLAVRLAASQKEEWKRIQGETRRLQVQGRVGLALSILGLLLMVAGYALLSLGILVAGAGLSLIGIPLLVVAQVRRSLARRLYVQTLVLSGLEASGIGGGAPDERVQPVIIALDRLLGALPGAEVQAFLATPQARAYLELVDEATRSQRGP